VFAFQYFLAQMPDDEYIPPLQWYPNCNLLSPLRNPSFLSDFARKMQRGEFFYHNIIRKDIVMSVYANSNT
jgi:hypothetical protein